MNDGQSPFLSIIIPAYNEESRLPSTIQKVFNFLGSQPFEYEVLVVENGSQDRTFEVAQAFKALHPQLKVLQESMSGKGLAVRRGMLEAHGCYRFMCDADLSMPIDEVTRFLPPTLNDFDIAIGSREAPGAVRYNEPFHRHLGGRLINFMIRALALAGLHDTQCGFKCFRGSVADVIFQRLTLFRWSFDIEVLTIARIHGYSIVEIPVPWYFNPESKLHVVQDAIQMGLDILSIRRNVSNGLYD